MINRKPDEVDWEARYRELQQKHRNEIAAWIHDARNNMTGVICTLELLKHSWLTQSQIKDLQSALHAASEVNEIFEQVLTRAKIEAGEVKTFDQPFAIQELMQSVHHCQQSKAQLKDLSFEYDIRPDCPAKLIGDVYLIQRVLTNLVDNAIKFTYDGGVSIQVKYERAERLCQFIVRDTGIGVEPNDQTRIFRIFQQSGQWLTRSSSNGFGIGLFICSELTALMNGTIELQSRPQEGSTFTITLPLATASNG